MVSPVSQTTPRHWVYLDDKRTHEVHAQYARSGPQAFLVTTEFPVGSREPTEMVQAQTPVRGEDELVSLLDELEGRLSLHGRYYRAEAGKAQWEAIAAPLPKVDLRAHESAIPGMEATGAKMRFHHFHGVAQGQDRLLLSMPRPGIADRHVLAELTFAFPRVDAGELKILHTRLAPAVLASAVAKEHVEAPRRGFAKLFEAKDYERTFGEGWFDKTRAMLSKAATRFIAGPAPVRAIEEEAPMGVPARLQEMRAALASHKVEAIKNRYVDPIHEAQLVEGGEHAIRKYVNGLRKKVSHQQSYDISLLEAALLTQYAIPAKMWDLASDEGGKLLRFMYGYG